MGSYGFVQPGVYDLVPGLRSVCLAGPLVQERECCRSVNSRFRRVCILGEERKRIGTARAQLASLLAVREADFRGDFDVALSARWCAIGVVVGVAFAKPVASWVRFTGLQFHSVYILQSILPQRWTLSNSVSDR